VRDVGIGLIGSGFMGKAHALAFAAAATTFDLPIRPRYVVLADIDSAMASAAAARLGFARSTGDWRTLVADPAVELVDITAPNALHEEMALAAIAAGKHVYCEKPLAATAAAAERMARAARSAGRITQVGFNYLKNPIIALARSIIAKGEIGDVVGFRGIHAEGYMADPATPWSWRHDPAGGGGAIADLGSHIIAMARFLVGPIAALTAQMSTVVKRRPVARGSAETRPVAVDDQAQLLVRFASGATGTIEASWIAPGRTMQLAFEITGTQGSLAFTQERFNELQLYRAGGPAGRQGFTTITAGPEHDPYGAFCPAPGHQLGFNDLKTIEVRDLLLAIGGAGAGGPDFHEGWQIQRVVDAAILSARERRWIEID